MDRDLDRDSERGIQYVMHVGVCVRDLERSIRDGLGFVDVGGLEVEGEPTATMLGMSELVLHAVYLERDGFRIELLHYPVPGTVGSADPRPMNQPGLTHFALRVDDLEATIARLTKFGGIVLKQSRVFNADYASHLVYVTDPDGTRLELVQTPSDPTR